jgi:guanylate kinase
MPSKQSGTQRGHLFVIAAPSGAGKTTLVHKLMETNPSLRFSVSYTTRPQRHTETDGKDYFFVSPDAFQTMVDAGDFLEHALVFDHCYGTSKIRVESMLNEGHHVILEIDWQGAQQVRNHMPDCRSIFLLPPSVAELKRRLTGRGTDSAEVIERRFQDALDDMSHWQEFKFAVINDNLDLAHAELERIVSGDSDANAVSSPALSTRINAILQQS